MNNLKKHSSTGAYLWTRCKRYAWTIIVLVILQAARAVLSVRFALSSKTLIDCATGHDLIAFRQAAIDLGLIIIGLVVGYALVSYMNAYAHARLDWHWKKHLTNVLFRGEYQAVSGFHTGEIVNRMTNDVRAVNSTLISMIPNVTSLVIRLVLATIVLAQIEPRFTAIIWVAGVLLLAVAACVRKKFKSLNKEVSEAEGKVSGFLQESLGKLLMIQALDAGPEIERRSESFLHNRWMKQCKRRNYSTLGNSVMIAGCYLAELVSTVYCGSKLLSGSIGFGTFTAVIQLVGMLEGPFMNISGVIPQYFAMVASAERLKELDDLPQELPASLNGAALYRETEALCAEQLSFSYEDRTTVLENVSFEIKKGSFVVITGESGTGKSTLLKILLGLLHPSSGSCYLKAASGTRAVDRETRGMFAYVPPGNMLISGTIRENLVLTRPQASEQELAEAIHVSCLEDVLNQLPMGLKTVIGENALGLSEGQAQRLNIARAVLSHAPILLLDEATSALDIETEQRVLERIHALGGYTCIAVTHRLSALQYADVQINVLQSGQVEITRMGR